MADPLLRVEGLTKRFGGLTASDGISLTIGEGELHAVIGPNGAGKTTFIGQLMGELRPDAGSIRFDGDDITAWRTPERVRHGLGRTFQIVQLLNDETALANVALAVQARQGHSFRFFARADRDPSLTEPAAALLDRVGLGARSRVTVSSLSHGERKQLELAVALAGAPRLLLLDEPMAGLGPVESRRMLDLLAELKGGIAMLLVEHDMETVFALADRISVLVYGRVIATGSAAEIQANPEVQRAYLGDGDA
ncbi:ABC transporter ATP-binding protein [Alsobacter sp. R-9]